VKRFDAPKHFLKEPDAPAAGPWQTEEPMDSGRYIIEYHWESGGPNTFHIARRFDSLRWKSVDGYGWFETRRIVAWARLNEPQEVPQ
jgi:hypothetical protein